MDLSHVKQGNLYWGNLQIKLANNVSTSKWKIYMGGTFDVANNDLRFPFVSIN